MKYAIKYLEIARDDLKEVCNYLSRFYTGTSSRFLTDLRNQISLLENTPHMFEQYQDDSFYRKMVLGDFLVFYHVDDIKKSVEIHRILHGSRNVKQYI